MRGQKHVLVVEDDPETLSILQARFEEFKIVVFTAQSYSEAMRLFMEHASHISGMLVDGTLTAGSVSPEGAEFIRDVRERGYTRPIVACSSSDDMNASMIKDGATGKCRAEKYRGLKETGPSVLMMLMEST